MGEGMCDVHCHVLPGLDDGSVDMEMSLEMGRALEACGFSDVACSPHMGEGPGGDVSIEQAQHARETLQALFDKEGVSVRLWPNGEHHLTQDMLQRIRQKNLAVPIGGKSTWLLVELPWHPIPDVSGVLFNVQLLGYQVLLAHPERYGYLEVSKAAALVESGVKMQLELGSFVGVYGERALSRAHALMRLHAAHVFASDLHRPKQATQWVKQALQEVHKKYGQEAVRKGLYEHPRALLEDASADAIEAVS
jgi:protein-tyrosine phosphatase